MANDLLAEIGSLNLFTITLDALGAVTGRQATLVTNPSPGKTSALVFVSLRIGGSAAPAGSIVEVRQINGDGQLRDDLCGASDAAYPAVSGLMNADYLGGLMFPGGGTDVPQKWFRTSRLGLEFGVAVFNRANQLASQVIVNGTFAADTDWTKGTGWTISGGAAHGAAGSASDLSATVAPLVSGRIYRVQYTISNYSAGTVTPKCGTQAGTARSANGTYTELIVANGTAFLFSKDSAFAADIDNVTASENFAAYRLDNDEIQ